MGCIMHTNSFYEVFLAFYISDLYNINQVLR